MLKIKETFQKAKESAEYRLELIVGIWTAVIILMLCIALVVGSIFFMKKYFKNTDKQDKKTEATQGPTVAPSTTQDPNIATVTPEPTTEPLEDSKGETVYAIAGVNVRSEPSTSADIIGKLTKGMSVTRISENSEGWSKVLYKNKTAYIISNALNENEPATTEPIATTKPRKTPKPTPKKSTDEEEEDDSTAEGTIIDEKATPTPTIKPTQAPTQAPTAEPTVAPTEAPTATPVVNADVTNVQ